VSFTGNQILIVEDSEFQRRFLVRWLKKNGYDTLEAETFQEAREKIRDNEISVVLLDWELPDGKGIDLIKEILASSPYGWLPIIMVTSHSEPERIKEALEAGATDYLSKPAERIELLARIFSAIRIKNLQDKLRETSIRDAMTGLYNRRYMEERMEQEFQRCKRHKNLMTIAMIDLDFFKKVNDSYGHEVGDQVLKILADVLKSQLRKSDILSRFGGEEFVIVLPETPVEGAKMVLNKVREYLSKVEISSPLGKSFSVTLSGGVAGGDISEFETYHDLLRMADKNLYEAKHSGRNCII